MAELSAWQIFVARRCRHILPQVLSMSIGLSMHFCLDGLRCGGTVLTRLTDDWQEAGQLSYTG